MFYIFIFICVFCFSACDRLHKNLSTNITEKNLKEMITPVYDEEETSIPSPKEEPEIIIPPQFKKKISLTLTEDIPIKTVLCETAKRLGIDFQLSTAINKQIIFKATNRPFIEVLDAICDIADLQYSIHNNFVRIDQDNPFTKSYNIQFLNFSRDSENKISIATEVSSAEAAPVLHSENGPSTHNSSVIVKTKNDFWQELEEGIKVILADNTKQQKYSINKQSGIITVCCDSKKHSQIKTYISKIKEATMCQVLIEAKIIEVHLENKYKRGIDWSFFNVKAQFGTQVAGNSEQIPFSARGTSGNIEAILKILEIFGSTRTISNPRITAMNNQAAILKVAKNHVYFKLNYDKTYPTTAAAAGAMLQREVNVSSDIKTVQIGIVLFVQPSIDLIENTVSLFLRPTISKLAGTVNDPAVDIAIRALTDTSNAQAQDFKPSQVPVIEVREVSSVLKLNDGDVVILGGFMETRSAKSMSGVPIVKDIPLLGEAFSSNEADDDVVELVILIKAKIARNVKTANAADIRLQRFVQDPRPF